MDRLRLRRRLRRLLAVGAILAALSLPGNHGFSSEAKLGGLSCRSRIGRDKVGWGARSERQQCGGPPRRTIQGDKGGWPMPSRGPSSWSRPFRRSRCTGGNRRSSSDAGGNPRASSRDCPSPGPADRVRHALALFLVRPLREGHDVPADGGGALLGDHFVDSGDRNQAGKESEKACRLIICLIVRTLRGAWPGYPRSVPRPWRRRSAPGRRK